MLKRSQILAVFFVPRPTNETGKDSLYDKGIILSLRAWRERGAFDMDLGLTACCRLEAMNIRTASVKNTGTSVFGPRHQPQRLRSHSRPTPRPIQRPGLWRSMQVALNALRLPQFGGDPTSRFCRNPVDRCRSPAAHRPAATMLLHIHPINPPCPVLDSMPTHRCSAPTVKSFILRPVMTTTHSKDLQ
ncbi:hypothetical protein N657DRAFT_236316 [Parathielavia appendiculata]|uniref:Uncharacterized protein n=1 Tax=Parathielavia appendiculata TaxID=2587402 RepID=A0AAN6Z8A1_9PEZI|nr:hypothetical protein N657DRAFT_236316 [Parathielavia appendiculata]